MDSIIERKTNETNIRAVLRLDGTGRADIRTGIGFLDHMLHHVAVHGRFDLELKAEGDLHIDPHHTLEDCALVLGSAFDGALGERRGIVRMGSAFVPMDEALAQVVIDFSGRPYCVFSAEWFDRRIGEIPVTLVQHFFESFAVTARANVHARVLYGRDDHHKAEALFKAFARALDQAVRSDPRLGGAVPSTKGTLGGDV